jgi:DNA invertase Pin-like site-specific DNA recombinase
LARRGELARLWVFKLNRLTRRGAVDLLATVHELRDYGCQVQSVADHFALHGPMGDVVIAVIGAMAEWELETQRDLRDAARAAAEARGRRWGRPPAGTKEQRAAIPQLIDKGLTLRKAAKEAGLSYAAAQRIYAAECQSQSIAIELPSSLPPATG